MELLFDDPTPRRFILVRERDESGVSGTGLVASGAQWKDGQVVLRWNTPTPTTEICDSIEGMERIHGHNGATITRWIDE